MSKPDKPAKTAEQKKATEEKKAAFKAQEREEKLRETEIKTRVDYQVGLQEEKDRKKAEQKSREQAASERHEVAKAEMKEEKKSAYQAVLAAAIRSSEIVGEGDLKKLQSDEKKQRNEVEQKAFDAKNARVQETKSAIESRFSTADKTSEEIYLDERLNDLKEKKIAPTGKYLDGILNRYQKYQETSKIKSKKHQLTIPKEEEVVGKSTITSQVFLVPAPGEAKYGDDKTITQDEVAFFDVARNKIDGFMEALQPYRSMDEHRDRILEENQGITTKSVVQNMFASRANYLLPANHRKLAISICQLQELMYRAASNADLSTGNNIATTKIFKFLLAANSDPKLFQDLNFYQDVLQELEEMPGLDTQEKSEFTKNVRTLSDQIREQKRNINQNDELQEVSKKVENATTENSSNRTKSAALKEVDGTLFNSLSTAEQLKEQILGDDRLKKNKNSGDLEKLLSSVLGTNEGVLFDERAVKNAKKYVFEKLGFSDSKKLQQELGNFKKAVTVGEIPDHFSLEGLKKYSLEQKAQKERAKIDKIEIGNAIEKGDLEKVQEIIKRNDIEDILDWKFSSKHSLGGELNQVSVLHLAIHSDKPDIVNYFSTKVKGDEKHNNLVGNLLEARDGAKQTPLLFALANNMIDLADKLVDAGANCVVVANEKNTPLHELAQAHIKKGKDSRNKDEDPFTKLAKKIIGKIDKNSKNELGEEVVNAKYSGSGDTTTPLQKAAENGNKVIFDLLIKRDDIDPKFPRPAELKSRLKSKDKNYFEITSAILSNPKFAIDNQYEDVLHSFLENYPEDISQKDLKKDLDAIKKRISSGKNTNLSKEETAALLAAVNEKDTIQKEVVAGKKYEALDNKASDEEQNANKQSTGLGNAIKAFLSNLVMNFFKKAIFPLLLSSDIKQEIEKEKLLTDESRSDDLKKENKTTKDNSKDTSIKKNEGKVSDSSEVKKPAKPSITATPEKSTKPEKLTKLDDDQRKEIVAKNRTPGTALEKATAQQLSTEKNQRPKQIIFIKFYN